MLGLSGVVSGLSFSWIAYFYHFSDITDISPELGFKEIAFYLGTLPFTPVVYALLSISSALLLIGFILVFLPSDKAKRHDLLGFLFGIFFLLFAIPLITIWGCALGFGANGAVGFGMMFSISGGIITSVYIYKTSFFVKGLPKKSRLAADTVIALGFVTGSQFLYVGARGYQSLGNFSVGRGLLILSPCFYVMGVLTGAIAFARDRVELLDIELKRNRKTLVVEE